jgi:hypothetical protein
LSEEDILRQILTEADEITSVPNPLRMALNDIANSSSMKHTSTITSSVDETLMESFCDSSLLEVRNGDVNETLSEMKMMSDSDEENEDETDFFAGLHNEPKLPAISNSQISHQQQLFTPHRNQNDSCLSQVSESHITINTLELRQSPPLEESDLIVEKV